MTRKIERAITTVSMMSKTKLPRARKRFSIGLYYAGIFCELQLERIGKWPYNKPHGLLETRIQRFQSKCGDEDPHGRCDGGENLYSRPLAYTIRFWLGPVRYYHGRVVGSTH